MSLHSDSYALRIGVLQYLHSKNRLMHINNRALVFGKTSALLLISSDMHQSVFAVCHGVVTY